MSNSMRAVLFPIVERKWLMHAWRCGSAEAKTPADPLPQQGGILGRIQNLPQTIISTAQKQWDDFQSASEGSLKNYVYKIARALMAREHPAEGFFKAIPNTSHGAQLEILYPAFLRERHVRRVLRLEARRRAALHRSWLRTTSIALLPFLPLAATPFPNLPIYYVGYRIYSHHSACCGAETVLHLLRSHGEQQRDKAGQMQGRKDGEGQVVFCVSEELAELALGPDKRDGGSYVASEEVIQRLSTKLGQPDIASAAQKLVRTAHAGTNPLAAPARH